MKSTILIVTIAIGVALMAVALQLRSSSRLQGEIGVLRDEDRELQYSLQQQTQTGSQLVTEPTQLQNRFGSLNAFGATGADSKGADSSQQPEKAKKPLSANLDINFNVDFTADDPFTPPRPNYQALMRKLTQPNVAEQMASAHVRHKYRPLLNSFDLNDEKLKQAEAIIIKTTAERNIASLQAVMGELDDDASAQLLHIQRYEQLLDNRLSTVLTPQQLSQVKSLRQTDEERRLRNSYNATTKQHATGLSEDNRRLLVDTIVAEMTRGNTVEVEANTNGYNPIYFIALQTDKLANVSRRLQGRLSTEQMAIVNRYLESQIERLNFTASLWKDRHLSKK